MTDLTKLNATQGKSPEDRGCSVEKRRSLLKAGMGGGVVLATLKSRSVLACNCTTPSAYGSINTSVPDQQIPCSGRTPGYWKQSQWFGQWPAPYYPTRKIGPGGHYATLFKNVFTPVGPYSATTTLLDVLNNGGGGVYALGRHIVAALLNAASGKTVGVLTVAQVINIWSEYQTKGYFEPTAGVHWNSDQIVAYLVTTMPL